MIFKKRKRPWFMDPRCLRCGAKEFEMGPTNGVVHNIKCKRCSAYHRVVPSRDKVEIVEPEYRW